MLPVAVDAMGGDNAPQEIIDGAQKAIDDHGIPVLLVGKPEVLETMTEIPILPASEIIEMDAEPGSSVRQMKDSSLVRAAEAVRDGVASAMVSAGNTGATMASALLRMGRIKNIARPAIATLLPSPGGTPTVLLDSGANSECNSEWLLQFGQMGAVFAQHRLGIKEPRVALLSIGEEPGKGSLLIKDSFTDFSTAQFNGGSFVGNIEGRDLLTDAVDVAVTDGFTGNVALKTIEGTMKTFFSTMLEKMSSRPEATSALEILGPELDELLKLFHPDTYGGAMLLGVKGVCIISHGSSGALAIENAIKVAAEMDEAKIVESLKISFS